MSNSIGLGRYSCHLSKVRSGFPSRAATHLNHEMAQLRSQDARARIFILITVPYSHLGGPLCCLVHIVQLLVLVLVFFVR